MYDVKHRWSNTKVSVILNTLQALPYCLMSEDHKKYINIHIFDGILLQALFLINFYKKKDSVISKVKEC